MQDKYGADKVLMVGDAPGDQAAAEANGVLFFPIIPGQEVECWSLMRSEAAEKFHKGEYAGEYMSSRIAAIDTVLKEDPEW